MENFLIRKNKKYKKQYQVGRRRIDFYIDLEKTFIEVDGERFHKDKERERQRDLEILLKYPDHKIAHVSYGKGDKGQPKWEYFTLEDLNHTGTFTQIDVEIESIENKQTNKNRQKFNKAYNFAVEEDESYMARGIVSHNCRCIVVYL